MQEQTVSKTIHETLKLKFGFETLRGNQEIAIQAVLEGKDCLNIMPTGGGKSLCYQLPAMILEGLTVVVSPLISLMQDQVENLSEYGIASAFLNSSLSFEERKQVEDDVLNEKIKILFVAPEGLLGFNCMSLLRQAKLSLFAIDEAHCVSQWGHEFRSDYRRLAELKEYFPKVPTIALTATADEKTRKDIVKQLKLNDPEILVSSFDRPNIQYRIYEKQQEVKQLTEFIESKHKGHTGIVYCLSRSKVDKVTEQLRELGYNALSYHAGMTPKKREKNLEKFRRQEEVIVVATIAFGMGIDRPDVRFVAHLDLPKSIEGYYQETGRAGRDGKESTAWMVYGLSDVVKLSRMIEQTEADEAYKKQSRMKLENMLSICESTRCRRQNLLDYFGQELKEACGNCDSCLEPVETWDASVACQKLLSTIYRTGQKFGAGYVIDVLRGSSSAKVKERFDNELSVYGIGKDLSKAEWNSIIRQLLCMGYIQILNWEYRNLGLTETCRPVLRGEVNIELKKLYRSKKKTISSSSAKNKNYTETDKPELFEQLRQLRLQIAKEQKVPPYIVLGDKSLHDMCWIMPENKEQMLQVHGIGESKWEKYGHQFLEEMQNYKLTQSSHTNTMDAQV